jgi:hypothetical protein
MINVHPFFLKLFGGIAEAKANGHDAPIDTDCGGIDGTPLP